MNNNSNAMSEAEKVINGEIFIKDLFSYTSFGLHNYDEVESVEQIIHYSPLVLRCYFNRKGTWITYNNISIKHSHPSYNGTLNRRIPKYINDVFETALDFKYDDESAYTSVKMMGFIYLNTFVNKWVVKDEILRNSYFSKFIDEFDIQRYGQYKDRNGKITSSEYIKASNLAGFKWYNLFINQIKKQKEVDTIVSSFISKDISNYVLSDYLNFCKQYITMNKMDESDSNTCDYKWKCKFYYYDLVNKKDAYMLTDLVYENGIDLGFPLYYSTDRKYYKADILFGIFSNEQSEDNVLFRINDAVKLINLNISGYQDILNGM